MAKRTCSISGCGGVHKGHGLCNKHLLRLRKHGDPARGPQFLADIEERFWSKVDKSGDCWLWTAGTRTRNGYGQFAVHRRPVFAHRFAVELTQGPIPPGMVVDHICHVKLCVRPAHLRVVTNKQNGENRAGLPRNNTSGIRGVYQLEDNRPRPWLAHFRHNGHTIHVGRFGTPEEAEAAVVAKRNELFTHNDIDRAWQSRPA